jgi:glc operon protein GlcG
MSLGGVIASEGGIPIVVGGKLVGAIGCSGATGAQDGQACQAGVNAVK